MNFNLPEISKQTKLERNCLKASLNAQLEIYGVLEAKAEQTSYK
jgi:hypothetical protein